MTKTAGFRSRAVRACLLGGGLLALALSGAGCGDDTTPPLDDSTRFVLDLTADLHDPASFYEVPYPSRPAREGRRHRRPRRLPRTPASVVNVAGLVANASEQGFPVIPVTFLKFTKDLAPRMPSDVIPADPTSPILLLDVDPNSPDRGKLYPTIAQTLETDVYTSEHVLAVAARPGIDPRARPTRSWCCAR